MIKRIGLPLLAPVVAVVIAVAVTSLVILISGSQSGIGSFWQVMLSKPDNGTIVNIINLTAMLYLSATASAIGFRMGLFNIGVEGQYRIGGYCAAVFAGAALLPGPLNVVVAIGIAMLTGAIWAGIAGLLKVTRGVSEVIATLMLNAIAPILISYLVNKYGILGGNTISTKAVTGSSTVKGWQIFTAADGQVWSLGILAVVVGVAFWVLLNKTRFGFDLRASGKSPAAAAASGVNPNRMVLIAMLLSGAVAGLIWMPEFFGSAYSYGTTFDAGLGFTGIAVALLGRNEPLGMAFGAVLFAWLSSQSNALQLGTDISPSIVEVTQGVVVLAVVIAYELVRRWRLRIEQDALAATPVVQEVAA
jgi:simple sugar transport system permease protein